MGLTVDDAIVLVPTACRDSQINLGLSKFGGNPDLPEDFQLDFDFKYFVGQINFDQISDCGKIALLPEVGILSLFVTAGTNNGMTVKAEYFATTNRLKRFLLPAKKHPCHPCRLTPQLFQSMPAADSRKEEYLHYEREFLRRFYPGKPKFDFDTPWHQILGFHRNIAQSQPLLNEDDSKILLLQIDSDSLVSMTWGYNGQLYFWIKRSELEARNFKDTTVELAQAKRAL